MTTLILSVLLILEPGAARRPASSAPEPPTIDWPELFASVTVRGVVYSDRIKALDGKRVRFRGYSVVREGRKGGILLTRVPYVESDPHGPDSEFDIPYDAVGVVWRDGLKVPPVPERPTVEGTLRLGNRTVADQIVVLSLEDAVPTVPRDR